MSRSTVRWPTGPTMPSNSYCCQSVTSAAAAGPAGPGAGAGWRAPNAAGCQGRPTRNAGAGLLSFGGGNVCVCVLVSQHAGLRHTTEPIQSIPIDRLKTPRTPGGHGHRPISIAAASMVRLPTHGPEKPAVLQLSLCRHEHPGSRRGRQQHQGDGGDRGDGGRQWHRPQPPPPRPIHRSRTLSSDKMEGVRLNLSE